MQEEISFGKWLYKQRRELDLTRQAFANQVGCAEVTLRRIEAGTLKPSKELASILLEKLGIPEIERPQWVSFARGLSDFPLSFSPSSNKKNSNLPTPLTTFIGREKEQSEVVQLITKYRLVTLTGSGGVGKTRLSIKVGEQVQGIYADDVWLVELAAILDPLLVPRTIAIAVGLRDEPQRPVIEMLCDYLREKKILIILDNCEHLLHACAQLIDTLLKSCPQLKILATSREPIGITGGEAVYRVPSLGLPDIQHVLDTFRDFEAVKLFEERTKLVHFDFSLTLENASSVAQICKRLDGIPLAIELAAAKMDMFSIEQIVKQLDESFNLLTGGSRTALPRHQTLQASMDWSWGLLSEAEQIFLRQLSVFAGGWTLESAQEVCDGNVLSLTSALMKKSLILVNQETGRETRYRFHETVRQYVREKSEECGDMQIYLQIHARCFLRLAEQAEPHLIGAEQAKWVNRLEVEHDNLRVAIGWLVFEGKGEDARRLGGALARFWWMHGHLTEGCKWLEQVLKMRIDSISESQAKAMLGLGILAWAQGDNNLARRSLTKSFEKYQELMNKSGMAYALNYLGHLMPEQGGPTGAQGYYEKSLAIFDEIGDKLGMAGALMNLGDVAYMQGDIRRARDLSEQSLVIFRELKDNRDIAYVLSNLGNLTYEQGNITEARKFHEESLIILRELGEIQGMANVLAGLANELCAEGQSIQSAQVQGKVSYLLKQTAMQLYLSDRAIYDRTTTALKKALGVDNYFKAFESGKILSLEQAIKLAIKKD